ncbi:hypothetical protein FOZ60_007249 [Perkinsus olseni]|uniref:Uncharacterized protein n=1 Tax=Perkinsus olseni TaxID=32597 RepID=A0A7J6PG41_PEROL|nr:hypothetical protein FOZ60_007249 [Perkinsus olseni]
MIGMITTSAPFCGRCYNQYSLPLQDHSVVYGTISIHYHSRTILQSMVQSYSLPLQDRSVVDATISIHYHFRTVL